MGQIEAAMQKNLSVALDVWRNLSEKDRQLAEKIMGTIVALKTQLEKIAAERGHSQACKESIATCRGVCCKWHFPNDLKPIDLFLALRGMPAESQRNLSNLIAQNQKHQCPVLQNEGCFFSFEQRPVSCTNAYPCFNDHAYWAKKEAANALFKKAFADLAGVIHL
jgi:hypothetical protein